MHIHWINFKILINGGFYYWSISITTKNTKESILACKSIKFSDVKLFARDMGQRNL